MINVTGTQIVDAWAIVPPSADEHLSMEHTSMEHTRASLAKLVPLVGDHIYSNHRHRDNLFVNIPWSDEGSLQFRPTVARPGDYVVLKPFTEIVVVPSACPMDVNAINGHCPSDVAIEISRASPTSFPAEALR